MNSERRYRVPSSAEREIVYNIVPPADYAEDELATTEMIVASDPSSGPCPKREATATNSESQVREPPLMPRWVCIAPSKN